MPKRTYVDACLLMAAFRVKNDIGRRALEILDDPDRALVVSDAVWLEVMPKPRYHKQSEETAFYEAIFDQAEHLRWDIATLYDAHELAKDHGLGALDAVHIAYALKAQVDELVTAEKPTKPMFRVSSLAVRTIREAVA